MQELINKWLNGEISDDDFRAIVGEQDLTKYRQILAEVDLWRPDLDNKIFDIEAVIKAKKEAKVRKLPLWMPISVAASVLLVLGYFSWIFLFNPFVIYETQSGQALSVQLPDGSTAHLAPGSQLKWNKKAYAKRKERDLRLKGKALFEVKKGDAFTVMSTTGKVEVLGTVFEVDDYESGWMVTCFEGKVRAAVTTDDRILEAGQSFVYENATWTERKPFGLRKPDYQERETKFDDAPLAQVVKEMERRFGIQIITGEVKMDRKFTGSYPNDRVDVALKLVFDALDIRFERKGDKVYLSR